MPDTWELASIAAKFLLYLGAVQSAGLSFIAIAFRRETEGIYHLIARRSRAIVLLALVASGLVFSLKGAAMMGDASGMLDVEILGVLWQTPIRIELMLRVAGLVLILTGTFIAGIGIWIAGIGGILALWSFAWVGHVASFELTWLKLLLIVHLAGIAFWVGVLSPLKTLAADKDKLSRAADLGHRFGRFAAVRSSDTHRFRGCDGMESARWICSFDRYELRTHTTCKNFCVSAFAYSRGNE